MTGQGGGLAVTLKKWFQLFSSLILLFFHIWKSWFYFEKLFAFFMYFNIQTPYGDFWFYTEICKSFIHHDNKQSSYNGRFLLSFILCDFMKLLKSFNLNQHLKHHSHKKGHTLDLTISHGFCVDDVFLAVFAVSELNAVLFHIQLLSPLPKTLHADFLRSPWFSQRF